MLELWEMMLATLTLTTLVAGGYIGYISGKIGVSVTRSELATLYFFSALLILLFFPMIAPPIYFRIFSLIGSIFANIAIIIFSLNAGWLIGYAKYRIRFRVRNQESINARNIASNHIS